MILALNIICILLTVWGALMMFGIEIQEAYKEWKNK